jgi:cytochrome c biogenesis protein CcmG/thiol:disulfide interchange protein DsbE
MRRFALAALILATAACSDTAEGRAAAVQEPVPGAGVTVVLSDKPLPLPAFTLTSVDGGVIDQTAWRGKVVLLNFWATWCGPCRAEIPDLIALQTKYKDQLVVIGLSVDEGKTANDAVKAFVAEHKLNYPVAIVDGTVEKLFGGVTSIPSTFVLNPDGKIVQRHVGTLNAARTEQEVRVLASLPTAAQVSVVEDTGQVLKANAAYATSIPGIDFTGMTPAEKTEALKRMNTEMCTCGCGSTIAGCRVEDPTCETSLPLAKKIVASIRKGKN